MCKICLTHNATLTAFDNVELGDDTKSSKQECVSIFLLNMTRRKRFQTMNNLKTLTVVDLQRNAG